MNSLNSKSVPILILGIDGGGSKCKAKVTSANGDLVGVGISGRANPLHGLVQAVESIQESAILALQDAGLNANRIGDLVAGIGLAGVNLPGLYKQVAEWEHPFKAMHLTTDLHIACMGAHNGDDGSVIITGTGSCGISVHNGQSKILGAHGFPIGDQGSGAWIGLKAVSAALLSLDGLGPKTQLTERIAEQLDIAPQNIAERMSAQPSKVFATLSPTVFQLAKQDDAVAVSIIREGAAYIDNLARKLLAINPNKLSLIGGLRTELVNWVSEEVASTLSEPIHQPEDGAILFAMQQMAKGQALSA